MLHVDSIYLSTSYYCVLGIATGARVYTYKARLPHVNYVPLYFRTTDASTDPGAITLSEMMEAVRDVSH